MFGKRRHPALDTVLVVGASRAAARREVNRQSASQAQQEAEVDGEVNERQRQETERDEWIQRAVEEALRKSNNNPATQPSLGSSASSSSTPLPTGSAPANFPGREQGANTEYFGASAALPRPNLYSATPQNSPTNPEFLQSTAKERSAAQSESSPVPNREVADTQYCPACGNACEMRDLFCRRCGTKQAKDSAR